MINLNSMSQMSEEQKLNLYRQGQKLDEGANYVRNLTTGVTCTPADTDPSHDWAYCIGYKYWYMILPAIGLTLYFAYRGMKGK